MYINKYYINYFKLDNFLDLLSPQIAVIDDDEDSVNRFTEFINKKILSEIIFEYN